MKTDFDILTFGSITLDIFLPIEEEDNCSIREDKNFDSFLEVPLGEKIQSEEALLLCGGGAANSAVGFSKLGLEAAAFGIVGDQSNGRFLLSELERNKVNTEHITLAKNEISSFSIILNTWTGKRTVFNHRANCHLFDKSVLEGTPSTRAIYLAHLTCEADSILNSLPAWCEKNPEVVIGWNPGKTQFKEGLEKYKSVLPCISTLILNVEEAEQFTGLKAERVKFEMYDEAQFGEMVSPYESHLPKVICDVRPLVEKFKSLGVKEVVITDGGRGAQIFSEDQHLYVPSKAADRKDTLGAGDAFSIGFISGKLQGKDLKTQATWAANNSASVIQHYGAQAGQLKLKDMS